MCVGCAGTRSVLPADIVAVHFIPPQSIQWAMPGGRAGMRWQVPHRSLILLWRRRSRRQQRSWRVRRIRAIAPSRGHWPRCVRRVSLIPRGWGNQWGKGGGGFWGDKEGGEGSGEGGRGAGKRWGAGGWGPWLKPKEKRRRHREERALLRSRSRFRSRGRARRGSGSAIPPPRRPPGDGRGGGRRQLAACCHRQPTLPSLRGHRERG